MERLTIKCGDGLYEAINPIDVCNNEYSRTNYHELTKRLGEYEDFEEQGKLLKLPCAVGDMAYTLNTLPDGKTVLAETTADAFFCALCTLEGRFGKTVFATQEEAEKVLKDMEARKMLIERKVQIEAIKSKKIKVRIANSTVMFTNGEYIVYVPEEECVIDISRINSFKENYAIEYGPDRVEKLLKPIGKTKKMLLHTEGTLRLFENKQTGDRIWLKQKYVKKFEDCRPYSADMGKGGKVIVFKRGEKIVGLVLPVAVSEEVEG